MQLRNSNYCTKLDLHQLGFNGEAGIGAVFRWFFAIRGAAHSQLHRLTVFDELDTNGLLARAAAQSMRNKPIDEWSARRILNIPEQQPVLEHGANKRGDDVPF